MVQPRPNARRRDLTGKSDAYLLSAVHDLDDAADLALRYLELVAQGKANASIERAFNYAMIVSYASPWSGSENPATAEARALVGTLDSVERRLHERLLHLRNQHVAHSNRKLTSPALHVEQRDLQLFSRKRVVLRHNDVIGAWNNAVKMRNLANRRLLDRYPRVLNASHEQVGLLDPVVDDRRAVELARATGSSLITDLLAHGWRDCDLVSLEEASLRLGLSEDYLEPFSDEAVRGRDGFPAPMPIDHPDRPGPLWRMSWIRRWASPLLVRMGT